jgi:hypothetical protein
LNPLKASTAGELGTMQFSPWPALLSAFLVVVQIVLVMLPGFWYTRRVSSGHTSVTLGSGRPVA